MIHLVDADNRHLYARELDDLFAARKEVFADGFGWDLPLVNGLDIDEFDDEQAVYTIGFDVRDNVVMALRFRPTDDKSLLGDLFPHALPANDRSLADGRTWEVTRGFCLEFGRKPWNMRRKGAGMTAPFELMLAAGRDRLVGFTDVRMLAFIINMGWQVNVLGDAVEYGEGAGLAFDVTVDAAALAQMRGLWGLPAHPHARVDELRAGETVHDAVRRIAAARDLEDLLPRDDLSRLRRRPASPKRTIAPSRRPPAPPSMAA